MRSQLFQQGIALLTTLLVVALTTITAVSMITRQQVDIRRTANVLNGDQAYLYVLGAESWAQRILLRDTNNVDHPLEMWATHLPPLPIPGGSLQGQIEDLQGRFNLNNLVAAGEINAEAVARFNRLLKILELPETLTQVLIDWLDADQEAQRPFGAEDNRYLLKQPAYRTADTIFTSSTELRLMESISLEQYQKLLPYIITLPTPTAVNVNTASQTVLLSLAEGMTVADVETLIADRDKNPFKSVEDFLTHKALAGLTVSAKELTVASQYFLLTTTVQIDRVEIQMNSLLRRSPNKVAVSARSQGEDFLSSKSK